MSSVLERGDVIDKASIIENKERIKIYWEQMMMMATVSESKSSGKPKHWGTSEINSPDLTSNRNYKNLYKNSNESTENALQKQDAENYDSESDTEMLSMKNQRNEKIFPLTMEGKIALELQEMKEREEELKEWRNKIAIENCKEICLHKDMILHNGNEELSSLQTTDESNYSEYGSEEKEHSLDDNSSRVNTPHSEDFMHLRTQSLDSVSSGHSSGSGSTLNDRDRESPRRRVIVRPYEDPQEQSRCYTWDEKETPIEKEIRLAKEREEELRREKGTAAIITNCRALSRDVKSKTSGRKDTVENDPRGIQHRLATSRIQQEIEEANKRERELRTEGKIISTSEETLDSKVTRLTQLVENSITENRYKKQKMRRSSSASHLLLGSKSEEKTKELAYESTFSPRAYKNQGMRKGVMQQFFSMKGKSFGTGFMAQPNYSDEGFQSKLINKRSLNSSGDVIVHTRKGYIPVAEKIQEELKDNQKREEELRLQRARASALARSQPNLLEILNDEEEPRAIWKEEERPTAAPRLVHSISNPNLLDESFDKMHKRPSNKKFSLLEEWEKRIKQNIQ